jgi:hypothetical protein
MNNMLMYYRYYWLCTINSWHINLETYANNLNQLQILGKFCYENTISESNWLIIVVISDSNDKIRHLLPVWYKPDYTID